MFDEFISKLNDIQSWLTFFPEEKEKTIRDVFEEFTEEQKQVVFFLVTCALNEKSEECISKEVIKERLLYLCKNRVLGSIGPLCLDKISIRQELGDSAFYTDNKPVFVGPGKYEIELSGTPCANNKRIWGYKTDNPEANIYEAIKGES